MSQPPLTQGGIHLGRGEGKSFWLLTDLHTFKIVGDDTNGALTVAELTAGPELGPPPHIHRNSDETFYILEGTFDFSLAGQAFYGWRRSVRPSSQGRRSHPSRWRRRFGESPGDSVAGGSGTVHRGSWQACNGPVGPARAARAVGARENRRDRAEARHRGAANVGGC